MALYPYKPRFPQASRAHVHGGSRTVKGAGCRDRPIGALRIGDTVAIPEPDYCYGLGTLSLRITAIGSATPRRDWIQLRGVQLGDDGREIKEREVLARVGGIRRTG